jgi:hypothetical protein
MWPAWGEASAEPLRATSRCSPEPGRPATARAAGAGAGVREEREDAVRSARAAAAGVPALDLRAGVLDEPVVRTPDGHAVTQAMQPRQRSKCSTMESLSGSPPRPWFIR